MKFTGNQLTIDGVTIYFTTWHKTKKCKKEWQGTYDEVTGEIVLTCDCGMTHTIQTKLDPIVPVPIEPQETFSRLSEMKDEIIPTN